MQSKKPLNSKEDIEELLQIAGSEETPNNYEHYSDDESNVMNFLIKYGISSGTLEVGLNFIYKIFLKTYPETKLSNVTFFKAIKEHVTFKYNRILLINKDTFKLKELYIESNINLSKADTYSNGNFKKHIEAYFYKYNIAAGSDLIRCKYLYFLYTNWCYENNKKSFTYTRFVGYASKMVTKTSVNGYSFFYIDLLKFKKDLNAQEFRAAQAWTEKDDHKKGKKQK